MAKWGEPVADPGSGMCGHGDRGLTVQRDRRQAAPIAVESGMQYVRDCDFCRDIRGRND